MDLTALFPEFKALLAELESKPKTGSKVFLDGTALAVSKRYLEATDYIVREQTGSYSGTVLDYGKILLRSPNLCFVVSRRFSDSFYLTSPNEKLLPYQAWKALEKAVANHYPAFATYKGKETPLWHLQTDSDKPSLVLAADILAVAELSYNMLLEAGIRV